MIVLIINNLSKMKNFEKDKVSIIMNCYNGSQFLKEAIDSILKQTYKNWEIIFWDNCSTDNSIEIVKNYGDKKIRIFKNKENVRLYKARNQAINKIEGEFTTFLDVDDYWLEDKLHNQIKKLKLDNSSFIYTNHYIKEKKLKIFSKQNLPYGYINKKLLHSYPIYISTAMLRSKIFYEENFRFNENYEILGDFDLFYKLSKKFYFSVIQEPVVVYRSHENNTSKKKVKLKIEEIDDWINKNELNEDKNDIQIIINENLYTKSNFYLKNENYKSFFKNFYEISYLKMKIKLILKFLIFLLSKKIYNLLFKF